MKGRHEINDWPNEQFGALEETTEPSGPVLYVHPVSWHQEYSYKEWVPLDRADLWTAPITEIAHRVQQARFLEDQVRAAFGYAKRVSELCERLEGMETALRGLLAKVDRVIVPGPCTWIPIQTFAPEPYEAVRPLAAVISPTEDGYEACFYDANLYASGDTEEEAFSNLKSVILDHYDHLSGTDDAQLGPAPRRQKMILATLVRRTGE
jgi:predicted RNase H-like HicB family nuclease